MKTIAAISTAAAPGGIGVIRISGDEARAVGDRVFKSVSGAMLCDMAGLHVPLRTRVCAGRRAPR